MENRILFRDIKSPLGPMIAGASERGACFLEWHDRGGIDRIKQRVLKRFGGPLEPGGNKHLDKLDDEIQKYFLAKLKKFTVKIDVRGSAFQERVWKILLQIPYGQTYSYGQIAEILEKPGASRAVGSANGANYLGIVIPCHRVIQADGGLRGYGGKVWRKKYLLELEKGLKPELPSQVQSFNF